MSNTVEKVVMNIMEEFVEDWGLDDIELTKETLIKADIGFDSSDTMQLFAAIQEEYPGVEFKFQDLVVQDETYVEDLKLGQIIVFVLKTLSQNASQEEKTA